MADRITAAFIAGLVVQKFVEAAAGEAGEAVVWGFVKQNCQLV